MKKVLSVLLSVLMIFSIAQLGTVTAFAADDTAAVAEEDTTSNAKGPVSGYRPFSVECDYCGETHEGFFGVFICMLHTVLSAVKLVVKAVQR